MKMKQCKRDSILVMEPQSVNPKIDIRSLAYLRIFTLFLVSFRPLTSSTSRIGKSRYLFSSLQTKGYVRESGLEVSVFFMPAKYHPFHRIFLHATKFLRYLSFPASFPLHRDFSFFIPCRQPTWRISTLMGKFSFFLFIISCPFFDFTTLLLKPYFVVAEIDAMLDIETKNETCRR